MSKKLCLNCQTRRADSSTPEGLYCVPCDELAGYENQHSDWGHDDVAKGDVGDWNLDTIRQVQKEMTSCWVCHPELDESRKPAKQGHTNTATHTHTSHAACDHPRTPKARETCRRARRAQA